MLKTLLLAGTAFAALSGAALAADLPLRSPPPAPFVAPPIFTWTGFYVGANAGYGFDNVSRIDASLTGLGGVSIPNRSDGFVGGGQIGYNYQFGAGSGLVLGIEADADYTDLSHTETFGLPGAIGAAVPALAGATARYHSSLDYLGTVRGRIGYAFNQFLVYGTGGFAYGGTTRNGTLLSPAGAVLGTASFGNTETGYAVGGGIEYALPTNSFLNVFGSSAVTLKAEYLHYDLGNSSTTISYAGTTGTARFRDEGDLARAGINYKF